MGNVEVMGGVGADMKVEMVVDVGVNVVEGESGEMQMVVGMSDELNVEVGWMSSPHLHKADGVKLVDDGE